MRAQFVVAGLFSIALFAATVDAATRRVGPGQTYTVPSQAAAAAQDGDVIEIDAGLYVGDVASWTANDLTIRGVGGLARLDAGGNSAEGKAIWVIKGSNTTVESIEFFNATVPDQNGAGIRQEGPGLTVRSCYFHDNEDGILGGAGDVVIEYSEFAHNGYGDGQSHNLYIANASSLTFRFNYSHHARIGHNLKTRAQNNFIAYNRIMDEQDGTSSYAIDIPDAGTSWIIGNLLQQGLNTDNSTMVAYAAESTSNPGRDLYVVNNTLVNDRGSGTFVRNNGPTAAVVRNNIFAGGGTAVSGPSDLLGNLETATPGLVDLANFDYRLADGSPAINMGVDPGTGGGRSLLPVFHYVHRTVSAPRMSVGTIDVGAYEYGNSDFPDAGNTPDAGAAVDGGSTGNPSGGCGCRAASPAHAVPRPALFVVFALALPLLRAYRSRRWAGLLRCLHEDSGS